MNISEYESVSAMTYLEYCDYLQDKYGIGLCDYLTKSWNKNKKVTRTSEGLIAHHKFEDHEIMLSHKEYAMKNPYEWQKAKNIIYCDYLEHLLLHILICENPAVDKNEDKKVGVGGVINYIVPELNDLYSGWKTNEDWRKNCHDLVINDKDVYLTLLKRFKTNCKNHPSFDENKLFSSWNKNWLVYNLLNNVLKNGDSHFDLWSIENNQKLFEEIKAL